MATHSYIAITRPSTAFHELLLQHDLEDARGALSTRDSPRGQTALPSSLSVTRSARHTREYPLQKDDRLSIPSYIEDHSVAQESDDDVQLRLSDVDLEFIRANPEFWLGIRGFGVKRQMRAIEGQRNLTTTLNSGRNTDQLRGYGRLVAQETIIGGNMTARAPICHDHGSCKGKMWGPHAIHICQFDT